ncbi:hypothetical protein CRI94_07305 [Longibacter salinarum]|uniref:Yip1 domain-containing protein n=1 Tax=Longibacter salinarum TaxID=1850348 RepID=A0A2A8CZ05_9BACT|nr:YIP1 family protein [Longibacter salinarum]PEN13860.1 hypothetical protein CRI94_07305 [Longibacter salinarum]
MTFQERILGVFKLDPAIFEDVEHDPGAMQQAVIVVAITALLSGAGSTLSGSGLGYAIASVFIAFLGWILWSVITYAIGTRVFEGTADVGEMLRVIGFAFAPQVLAIIPCIGAFIGFFWSLAAGFIAVRQGLDLDNGKTALTIGAGALIYFVLIVSVTLILGTGRMLGM